MSAVSGRPGKASGGHRKDARGMSIIGLSMAALPCCAEEDVEAGSAALRVDWPVYPRRAEHNTVAEGGNRRWAETARQNAFQSRWPRPTRGPPGRRHQRRLTSPPLPSRGARRQGLNGPAHPIRRLMSRLRPSPAGMRALRASGALERASRQDRSRHLGAARCGGRLRSSTCAFVTHEQAAGAGVYRAPCLRNALWAAVPP